MSEKAEGPGGRWVGTGDVLRGAKGLFTHLLHNGVMNNSLSDSFVL